LTPQRFCQKFFTKFFFLIVFSQHSLFYALQEPAKSSSTLAPPERTAPTNRPNRPASARIVLLEGIVWGMEVQVHQENVMLVSVEDVIYGLRLFGVDGNLK